MKIIVQNDISLQNSLKQNHAIVTFVSGLKCIVLCRFLASIITFSVFLFSLISS